jgi:hypothetical protein
MKDQGFEQWWNAWPKNTTGGYQRKGGKSLCMAKWVKGCYWTQADQIVKHTEWMKTTADWIKDRGMFIPMPITYLNQQRWDGAEIEAPVIEKPKAYIDPAVLAAIEHSKLAVAPSDEIRQRLAALRGRA